ncbi:GNAT family N-acetyltransferase [Spirosoma rhododendri]|uniref:GNAT family N-acetyltransferase n=1 Tax=Spirosoma rhododendri TaxID=2728024 RepID=A0A7L5DRZ9_9BACT|nr:GNAT family protein [Spirosoma rhododendri]QJD80211.1 GNAT family N-acetyltransferase [Spirosoma rhododendri]
MQLAVDFDLRPWTMDDLGSLVSYANNPRIARNMTDKFPHPYTEADGLSFIEFATADSSAHIFAIDVAGEAVGGIGVHPQPDIHRKNAELGYWLAEPFWGKGIISAAIKRAVDVAFETYDIDRIFARPFGTNVASQRVLQKNGFVLEAQFRGTLYKNGEYLDELIYALRRPNWKPD